jgi:RNA polymerase sigma-54 factor
MLKQSLQQKLLQKLSPQQIQLMKLLQVPAMGLEQRIKEELENNPALEEGSEDGDEEGHMTEEEDLMANTPGEEEYDDNENKREDFSLDEYLDDDEIPNYKLQVKNSGPDEEQREVPISGNISFQDNLIQQLGLRELSDLEYQAGLVLIGNIDDDGYLRRDIPLIADDLAFSQNIHITEKELEKILLIIHDFDPPGIGARNLGECLLIQLRRRYAEKHEDKIIAAIKIIEDYMEEFSKKHYDKIAKKLNISDESLKDIIHEITRLNPKPGNTFSDGKRSVLHVIPDFILLNSEGGDQDLYINSRNSPDLKVSKVYTQMLEEYSKSKLREKEKKEAVQFVKQKIDSAKWFIDAIKQREITLLSTMRAIYEYQKEYFRDGDETKLKPMILKDIADRVGLDISTVSRVANSKYIQTPFGTLLLKSFFSESLSTDSGEEVSTREVKKILEDCISAENKKKPLPDDKLAAILKEKGYNIARRTVAKYREQLGIPVARMRKEV